MMSRAGCGVITSANESIRDCNSCI